MGAIGCMWLGARRAGHALLSALAYPAMGLMLVTLMLAYSRGALVALVLGLALWFCIVPLRLRGAAVLCGARSAPALVVAWDFSQHALTTDRHPARRTGHRRPPARGAAPRDAPRCSRSRGSRSASSPAASAPSRATRSRAGAALLALLVLAVFALAGGSPSATAAFPAASPTRSHAHQPQRHAAHQRARAPDRDRQRARALLERGAGDLLRPPPARGWRRRLRNGAPALPHGDPRSQPGPWLHRADARRPRPGGASAGACAARAPGWPPPGAPRTPSTGAGRAGARGSRPARGRPRAGVAELDDPDLARYTPERIGLLSMLCLVAVFGVHSFVDWTWYVPGDACVALLCAGWLAGRGPLTRGRAIRAPPRIVRRGRGSAGAPGEPRRLPLTRVVEPATRGRCRGRPDRRAARGLGAVAAAALGQRLPGSAGASSPANPRAALAAHRRPSRATRSRCRRCSRSRRSSRTRANRRWRGRRSSRPCTCSLPTPNVAGARRIRPAHANRRPP